MSAAPDGHPGKRGALRQSFVGDAEGVGLDDEADEEHSEGGAEVLDVRVRVHQAVHPVHDAHAGAEAEDADAGNEGPHEHLTAVAVVVAGVGFLDGAGEACPQENLRGWRVD